MLKNSYHRILERREYCSLLQCSFFYGVLIHVGWTRRGGLSGELFGDLLKCFWEVWRFPWYD
ncbi:hypothetical protein DW950_04770 [Phocaeicola vulgatus]|nr:hypothetical protein DW950_04770 [Phocaeicola vulgatus]